ncbi:unnamed protein product [Fusarium equiseti]|uniref:Uncharacterized protein n=1 Tax=Fusarium equiseti TaxID=61235 RepID=A0A8J2IMB1_FUSEQ|nr:unnamed protein product [Fusarium equiseti]
MRVPDTPSTPSSSKSPAMDNPYLLKRDDNLHPSFLAELRARSNNLPPIPKAPPKTVTWTTLERLGSRLELDLDDIEECALVLNDPRASDGFLFTPKLFQALGDNPSAVWYGRHTLFIVGEPGFHSLLHWDRCFPHYIAHYDPLQDRDCFTCPPQVQSLVMATFHRGGCPDLPIKHMDCDKSGSIDSALYSLCFAQALLKGQEIPPRVLPKPLRDAIENFHKNPVPPTSNVVQMRPIRRSAQGPLEWSMLDAKVSSTSSSEPCLIPPYPSDRVEQVVDSVQGTTASPRQMPEDLSSCVSSPERIVLPATFGGEQDVPFPHGSLPVRSAPINSGAAPETIPTKSPSAKGKEPATSSTNNSSTKDKELEAGATNPPSAKGKERQGSWQERLCEFVDNIKNLEAQEKLVGQLLAVKDHPPLLEDASLLEEAFNKFAADENDALIANGKEPRYLSFKEFMLAGVNQHFEVKVKEAKSKVSKMVNEVIEAAASKGQTADQSPKFHEMMSIYAERLGAYSPSLFAQILKYYHKSRAGVENGPSAKGKEPAISSANDSSPKEKESEASVTFGPSKKGKEPETSSTDSASAKEKESQAGVNNDLSVKGKERQGSLYEEVMAEYTESGLVLAKLTSEAKVASAAVLLAKNRLGGVDFDLSELKKWLDFLTLTKEELTKVCDQASLFVSEILRDCILNRDCRVEQWEKEDLVVDIHLKRMRGTPLMEELIRLEKEENAKTEAKTKIRGQFVNAVTKKGFLDDAREGRFAGPPLPGPIVKNTENLFGSREFLSYVQNHDSHGRARDNAK